MSDRNVRQRDLVPNEVLRNTNLIVVGAGAVGRQVTTLLANMGAKKIHLVDSDVVSIENLAVQGYRPDQIGVSKVEANRELENVNPGELTINPIFQKFDRFLPVADDSMPLAIFSCVDNMESRSFIWKAGHEAKRYKDQFSFFVDGRIAAEHMEVYTWVKGDDRSRYEATIFPDVEAHPASCTGRTTLYSSFVVAGMMVGEFVKWLRGQNSMVCREQSFNMLINHYTAS